MAGSHSVFSLRSASRGVRGRRILAGPQSLLDQRAKHVHGFTARSTPVDLAPKALLPTGQIVLSAEFAGPQHPRRVRQLVHGLPCELKIAQSSIQPAYALDRVSSGFRLREQFPIAGLECVSLLTKPLQLHSSDPGLCRLSSRRVALGSSVMSTSYATST